MLAKVNGEPITEAELQRYGNRALGLLSLPPGMTGYWQINGRSDVSYDARVRLDMAYVGSWSIGLDLLIVAKTFRALISKAGAY